MNNNNKRKRKEPEVSSSDQSSSSEVEAPALKKIKIEKEISNAEALNDTKDGKGGNKDGAPLEEIVNTQRYRALYGTATKKPNGPIVYWMSRDQRVDDNWAMVYAQQLANQGNPNSKKNNAEKQDPFPISVVFNLVPTFLNASKRHYAFMLKGLRVVEKQLKSLNIPFFLLEGNPYDTIHQFAKDHKVSHIITDFSPLRINREWKDKLITNLSRDCKDCAVHEIDAHNIVPLWIASTKQEVGARTLRPKIHRLLPTFLTEFPKIVRQETATEWQKKQLEKGVDWDRLLKWVDDEMVDVPEIDWADPGPEAALQAITDFIDKRLKTYASKRNDPAMEAQSNLSPYFHYGSVAAQRVALQVKPHRNKYPESVDSFLEESIVRRELADNFCHYNKNYDSFDGFAAWAQQTLRDHKKDKRPVLYTQEELEFFKTHDNLWNACQLEMVRKGKMHGFMRMYWAKKILEWTESPEEALRIAVYLNDKYEMDGRDPNGYVGCAWAIGGVHDQGWAEREIFGKIRYMNYAGCKRKFDINSYITLCKKFLTKEEQKKFTKDLVPIPEDNIKVSLNKKVKK